MDIKKVFGVISGAFVYAPPEPPEPVEVDRLNLERFFSQYGFIVLLFPIVIIGVVIIVLVAKSKKQQWRCVCGTTNKKTDEFCSNCGRANPSTKQNPPAKPKQGWQCVCGTVNRETDEFCPNCGKKRR